MNSNMLKCKYDVRGEIYLAAVKRTQEGKEVIYTNVGNPQALGQTPVTFSRQVMALLMAPFLLDNPKIQESIPSGVTQRAKAYLANIIGGVGAYSDSRGNAYIRQEITTFIQNQSEHSVNIDNIFFWKWRL